jgi:hypothetical protein
MDVPAVAGLRFVNDDLVSTREHPGRGHSGNARSDHGDA